MMGKCHSVTHSPPKPKTAASWRTQLKVSPAGRSLRLQPRQEDPACKDRTPMRVKYNMLSALTLRCESICPSSLCQAQGGRRVVGGGGAKRGVGGAVAVPEQEQEGLFKQKQRRGGH